MSGNDGIVVGRPTGGRAEEQVHGSDLLFRADPAGFIRNNACMLQAEIAGPDGTNERTFNRATCGTRGLEFMRTGDVRLTARLMTAVRDLPGLPLIQAVEGTRAEGERVCFLPWKEDTCTLTKLSTAATLFLTGPLSGCNIYIAQKSGHRPLIFHGNLNSDGEDRNTNNVRKDKEAINIASAREFVISHRLARGDYQIPAFVWGTRAGDTWNFFVHEVNPVDRSFTNKAMPTL